MCTTCEQIKSLILLREHEMLQEINRAKQQDGGYSVGGWVNSIKRNHREKLLTEIKQLLTIPST